MVRSDEAHMVGNDWPSERMAVPELSESTIKQHCGSSMAALSDK